jgi:hypothetical protein
MDKPCIRAVKTRAARGDACAANDGMITVFRQLHLP